jgi:hypothetical protein
MTSTLFKSKGRVETLDEAMAIFGKKLMAEGVADEVASMLEGSSLARPKVKLTCSVHFDEKTKDHYAVKFATSIGEDLSQEGFFGLE